MSEQSLSRRRVMRVAALGVAAVAVVAPSVDVSAQTNLASGTPVPSVTTDGIGGGGALSNGAGTMQFALTAFAVAGADGAAPIPMGSFTLQDLTDPTNPINLVSTTMSQYAGFSTSKPNARQIIGWATNQGDGPYPFVLQVEDIGPAGSGKDTFNLAFGQEAVAFAAEGGFVCKCDGKFSYGLRGNVIDGDLTFFKLVAS